MSNLYSVSDHNTLNIWSKGAFIKTDTNTGNPVVDHVVYFFILKIDGYINKEIIHHQRNWHSQSINISVYFNHDNHDYLTFWFVILYYLLLFISQNIYLSQT